MYATWIRFGADKCPGEAETFTAISLKCGGSVGVDCQRCLARFTLGAIGYRAGDLLAKVTATQFRTVGIVIVVKSSGCSFGKLYDRIPSRSLHTAHFYSK